MKRGDLVTVVLPGDYGKPRPAILLQSNAFCAMDSVIVAPLTSTIDDAPLLRIRLEPNHANGLLKPSAVMIDKLTAVARSRIGFRIGEVDAASLQAISQAVRELLEI